jgi:type IV secretory pathway TrbD component
MAKRTPTFQCLSKPILLAGCEHKPAVLMGGSIIMCALMAWFAWSLIALGMAAFLFLVGMPFLQQMAKRDPQMADIALRYASYARHYPAQIPWDPDHKAKRLTTGCVSVLLTCLIVYWWFFL